MANVSNYGAIPTLADHARMNTQLYEESIANLNTYMSQGLPTFYIQDEGPHDAHALMRDFFYSVEAGAEPEPEPEPELSFREQKERTQRLEYDTLLARRDRTRPKEAENNGYYFFPDWAHSTTAMVWDVVRILGRLLQDGVAVYDVWAGETKSISGLDTPRKMGVS